jgi:hypothetical protein
MDEQSAARFKEKANSELDYTNLIENEHGFMSWK